MRIRSLPLALAAFVLTAGSATAAVVTLGTGFLATSTKTLTHTSCTVTGASADISIDQAHPTVVNNTSVLTTLSTANAQKWILIKFSLASCSNIANASVDAATLKLYVTSASGSGHSLRAYKIDTTSANNWSTSTTWNTKPSRAASPTATLTPTVSTYNSFDVTNDVNDVLQTSPTVLPPYTATANNNGWIVADEGTNTNPVTAQGTEASSNKPQLVIQYAY